MITNKLKNFVGDIKYLLPIKLMADAIVTFRRSKDLDI